MTDPAKRSLTDRSAPMSSNPLDRRSQRSRHAILNAMLTLLGEQTFAQISVAQICLRADVARPTFYLHFSSKQEALLSFMDDVFEQFFAGVEPQLPLAELDTQAICLQLFEQWQRRPYKKNDGYSSLNKAFSLIIYQTFQRIGRPKKSERGKFQIPSTRSFISYHHFHYLWLE